MFNLNAYDPLVGPVTKIMEENAIRRKVDELVQESMGLRTTYGLPAEVKDEYEALKEGFAADLLEAGVKLMEVSAERMKAYKEKAGWDMKRSRIRADDNEHDGKEWEKHYGKMMKRENGIRTVNKRTGKSETDGMREETQLDEVSKERLGAYVKKSSVDMAKQNADLVSTDHGGSKSNTKEWLKAYRKRGNRIKGVGTAVDKLTKEENEQLDEVSKERLGRVINRIYDNKSTYGYRYNHNHELAGKHRMKALEPGEDKEAQLAIAKKHRGIADEANRKGYEHTKMHSLAVRKLTGKAKVNATEETQLDEVSKERLSDYREKAAGSINDYIKKGAKFDNKDRESVKKADAALGKAFSRQSSDTLARRKISGTTTHPSMKPKVLAKEESGSIKEASEEKLRKYLGRTIGSKRDFKKRLGQDYSKENRNRDVGQERALAKIEKKHGKEYYTKVKVAAKD